MLEIFDPLRQFTITSVALRILLAVLCGGAIGMEREYKRRPAGFRTHILICLGAALTTMTSQFLYFHMGYYTDIGRLGAQVVAGVGFIGAGTIIVTRRQRVKGLTTAAGLWTAAIVGLALGAGFYEGGLIAAALVLFNELVFSRLESRVLYSNPEINLYMEYLDKECLESALSLFRENGIKVVNMEITRAAKGEGHNACALFSLRLQKKFGAERLISRMQQLQGIVVVEEL